MKKETVNKVAELYKEKSVLYSSLSRLETDKGICICPKTMGFGYGYHDLEGICKDFLREIKELTIEQIKKQITEIDKQLEEL